MRSGTRDRWQGEGDWRRITKVKVGDPVGVGCMVGSDRTCKQCKANMEQFCANMVLTYGSPDKDTGKVTYGGYTESIVVDEHFVLKVPANLDLAAAAPLLCAGITTFSPLHHWGVTKGKKVGIVGLGGLSTKFGFNLNPDGSPGWQGLNSKPERSKWLRRL